MAKFNANPKVEAEIDKLSWSEAPQIITEKIPGPESQKIFDKEFANAVPVRVQL